MTEGEQTTWDRKRCPNCGAASPMEATHCALCGHYFGSTADKLPALDAPVSARTLVARPTRVQGISPSRRPGNLPHPFEVVPDWSGMAVGFLRGALVGVLLAGFCFASAIAIGPVGELVGYLFRLVLLLAGLGMPFLGGVVGAVQRSVALRGACPHCGRVVRANLNSSQFECPRCNGHILVAAQELVAVYPALPEPDEYSG